MYVGDEFHYILQCHSLENEIIYIKKSNEIRMLVHIKEISKKKEQGRFFKTISRTNVFIAVADLQVQCLYILSSYVFKQNKDL